MSRRESGAAAVEFAFVLLPLLLLIFGVIEFGVAYNRQQGMQAAAREGARVAAIGVDKAGVDAAVKAAATSLVDADDLEITWDGPCDLSDVAAGTAVTVVAKIATGAVDDYSIVIPVTGLLSSPDYEARGVFKCERPGS